MLHSLFLADVNLFLEQKTLLDHHDLFDDGHDDRVVLLSHGRDSIDAAVDGNPFDNDFAAKQLNFCVFRPLADSCLDLDPV